MSQAAGQTQRSPGHVASPRSSEKPLPSSSPQGAAPKCDAWECLLGGRRASKHGRDPTVHARGRRRPWERGAAPSPMFCASCTPGSSPWLRTGACRPVARGHCSAGKTLAATQGVAVHSHCGFSSFGAPFAPPQIQPGDALRQVSPAELPPPPPLLVAPAKS